MDSPFIAISFLSVYSQKSTDYDQGNLQATWLGLHILSTVTKRLAQVLSDYVGTPKAFGVFRPDQWLRGVTAMSRACLLACLHKIRNFLSTHTYENSDWKLWWHAWEPYRVSMVVITWKLPISQQSLVFFTCVDWNIFAQLSEYYTPLKSATLFFSVQ